MKRYLPYIAILIAMLIWGASGIAIKQALVSFPPLTMIVLRFTIAALLMLAIGLIFKGNSMLGLQTLQKKDMPLFALGGFFLPFLYYILETYTYDLLSSPTIAEALLSTSPLLSPLFALMIKEQVTRNNILGIVISSVGMLMLFLLGASDFSIGNKWGILMAALSVSTAVLYSAVLRRIPKQYNSLSIVFYIQLFSLILFYPLWAFSEGGTISQTVAQWGATAEWWQAFAAVIYLAAFSSVTAYILFCYTVRQLGITRANSFNNIRPVFTALIMFVCFGEVLPVGKIAGIAMIIIGLFVSQKKSAKQ